MDIDEIRRALIDRAAVVGWEQVAAAIGVTANGMRKFAKGEQQALQPRTRTAILAYLQPSALPSDVAGQIRQALARARETVALLEALDAAGAASEAEAVVQSQRAAAQATADRVAAEVTRRGAGRTGIAAETRRRRA